MVTLLKDYEQQTYVLNTADDIGDIVFHNGDQVFLMDQDLLLIYDEDAVNWYPVPTGGGGGGGGISYELLNSGTYTLATTGSSMTIPVTYTGTPKLIYIEAATGNANGGTWVWVNWLDTTPLNISMVFNMFGALYMQKAGTSNAWAAPTLANRPQISATAITVSRSNTSNNIIAQDYNWYIYGEA